MEVGILSGLSALLAGSCVPLKAGVFLGRGQKRREECGAMKKLWVLFAAVLIVAVSAASAAPEGVSGTLARPLRFLRPVDLGGAEARRLEVSGLPGPVTVSDGEVVGAPGSVAAGSQVSILWRGVEVGRTIATADGSFRAAVPALPDLRVSVCYGSNLPELRPWVNMGAYVYPSPRGTASATSWYEPRKERPECAFDQAFSEPADGSYQGSVWGRGFWGSGTTTPAWVERNFCRDVTVHRIVVWNSGLDCDQAWHRVDLLGPSGTWFRESGWIKNVRVPGDMAVTSWEVEVPGGFVASALKLTTDLSVGWNGVWEVGVLGDFPLEEVFDAPAWTLPEGEEFAGVPVPLVKPASWSGHSPSYWPDPDAWWLWCTEGANSSALVGKVRFRVPFEVRDPVDALLYVAADDKVTAWFDGVKILYWQAADKYGGVPLRLLPAGTCSRSSARTRELRRIRRGFWWSCGTGRGALSCGREILDGRHRGTSSTVPSRADLT